MTKHEDRLDGDAVFRFDMERAADAKTDALSRISARPLDDSKQLRQRSAQLRDQMMRDQSA